MINVKSENSGISIEISGTGLDLIIETSAIISKLYQHLRINGISGERVNQIFLDMIFMAADDYENEVENGNIQA